MKHISDNLSFVIKMKIKESKAKQQNIFNIIFPKVPEDLTSFNELLSGC